MGLATTSQSQKELQTTLEGVYGGACKRERDGKHVAFGCCKPRIQKHDALIDNAPWIRLQHLLEPIQLLHTTLGDQAWRTMHKFVHDDLQVRISFAQNQPFQHVVHHAKVQHTDQDACKRSTQKWKDTQCCDEKGSSALPGSTVFR